MTPTATTVAAAESAGGSQIQFWDRAAQGKVFAHPLDGERFQRVVPATAAVLDYGCGRGRLCGELGKSGYRNVVGVDYSPEMIATAQREHPGARFDVVDGATLPFADGQFDAVVLFAVLTCIADDAAQRDLIAELRRVLQPGGLLLVSDYPLQGDARNVSRYDAFAAETSTDAAARSVLPYGVFRLPDGGLVRHHTMAWLAALFADFTVLDQVMFDAKTMNGNAARIVQWWLRA